MLICGTVPIEDLALTLGEAKFEGEFLGVNNLKIPCTQGTVAVTGAAFSVTDYLKLDPPQVLIAGDTGRGKGSNSVYEYLIQRVSVLSPDVLVLHYCLPNVASMRKLCESIRTCSKSPILIADAGSMYAAKAAGLAMEFDIFTPDLCEMGFLADPDATHPAYINKHLFEADANARKIPKLVATAYQLKSAPKLLLVKGAVDYIAREGKIIDTVSEPNVPELEAIGGTGDTITGMVSAFVYAGMKLHEAAKICAIANRTAGKLAQAKVTTKVWQLITQFPVVFEEMRIRRLKNGEQASEGKECGRYLDYWRPLRDG